ncbi:MAG: hypothetical protein ACREEE_07870, partial [Dongiaceae bacterium]
HEEAQRCDHLPQAFRVQGIRPRAIGWLWIVVASLIWTTTLHGAEPQKSGTLQVEQVQIAFIGSGNLGGGTLEYGGKTYSFTIGGLGIGGIGISKIEATGIVYDMKNVRDFEGGYVQGRYGIAIGSAGGGELWLQNNKGVIIALKAKREGLALSLGGDAVYIKFN